jgi:hypothetical protein
MPRCSAPQPRTGRSWRTGARLVASASGKEVISETTVYTGPDAEVSVGSQVTVWAGTPHERTTRVITTSHCDHPAAWSHLEIALT